MYVLLRSRDGDSVNASNHRVTIVAKDRMEALSDILGPVNIIAEVDGKFP